MAEITVHFYTLWRLFMGVDRLRLEADNVEDAMQQIEENFGTRLREQLQGRGFKADRKVQDYSVLLLNGLNVRTLKLTELAEGDILHVFPAAMGG